MRLTRPFLAGVAAGIVVGVAVSLISTGLVIPYYQGHYVCVRGNQLASQMNWTPDLLLNSPYGGWGNVTYHVGIGGFGSGSEFNGAAGSVIVEEGWNLSEVNRIHLLGAGVSSVCPQYQIETGQVPAPGVPFSGCAGCPILANGTQSDIGEPAQLSYNSTNESHVYRSVVFDDSFSVANQGSLTTCSGPAKTLNMTTHELSFLIPFFTPNGTVTLTETVYAILGPGAAPGSYDAAYSYWFPGNFGTWQIDNLSASGGPGGGWAFNFLGPCS